MKNFLNFLKYLSFTFGITGIVITFFIVFNKVYFNYSFEIDPNLASKFGSFFGGFVGTLFTMLSLILIMYTIVNQNIENKKNSLSNQFFKMIDYHNQNVQQINIPNIYSEKKSIENGRRAFVVYKIQIKRLIELLRSINNKCGLKMNSEEIIDISYIIFYYGIDEKWINFIQDKLKHYPNSKIIIQEILKKIKDEPNIKIGRTNQTNLSSYFRNMYNAIKLIDHSKILSTNEKKELIKIYRAQLSNPELYVLFFNIVSRFGKKWKKRNFIEKYEFIKNIPKDYCDGFNPKDFFQMTYEYEEL